jgi:DNA-directed RNA polymerase subunit RPC12/RpoP
LPTAAPKSKPPRAEPVEKEPTVSKAPPKGKLFPCLNCGAKVEFDPRQRALKCPYCGHTSKVEDSGGEVEERSFKEYASKLVKGNVRGIEGRSTQTKCSGCGAMVLLEDKVVTDDCPFCGTHLENKPEAVEGMLPPESLIPFRVDLRDARERFQKWLEGLWFAPTELKKVANLGQLSGVYIPYWTYDAMTYTKYRGMRGDDYQETEYYTERDAQGNEVQRSRTVTKTNWYPVSGEVQHFFDDVLVCGSKSVPEHLIDGMEPWDTGELEPFQDSFLAGLKTERYAVDLKKGLVIAKQKMEPVIHQLIREDIGGDHQRIEMTDTRYLGVTFKHCLLPVWVAHYRYHEKLFQILINGRSGKVSGERPWSWAKIVGLIAIIALVIGAIIAIVLVVQGKGGRSAAPAPVSQLASAAGAATPVGRDAEYQIPVGADRDLPAPLPSGAGPRYDHGAWPRRAAHPGDLVQRVQPEAPRRLDHDAVPAAAV